MLAILAATALATPDGFYFSPDIFEDKVAFSSEGDLWVGDLTSRRAIRLTSDAGTETFPKFSPDGKWIAFQAEYDGNRQAYVMPSEGGTPTRLTNVPTMRAVTGWTADGKNVVYRVRGPVTGYQYFTIPAVGGAATQMPLEFASHVDSGPSGGEYAMTRFARFYMAWFRYAGGLQNQIWTFRDGKFKQITNIAGTNEFPTWVGNQIYFANENDAKFTLMSVPAVGGNPKKISGTSPVEIRNLAGDTTRLVYEQGTDLEMLDTKTGKVEKLTFERSSDLLHTRPMLVTADRFATAPSLSSGNKRVLMESRGQIISLPVGEGESRLWKATPGARLRIPAMSPDGKKVAYVSDESREQQVMVADADGNNSKVVTSDSGRQLVALRWSPDSKLVAVADSHGDLSLVDVATMARQKVANVPQAGWYGPDFDFSPDGKWVAYSSYLTRNLINQVMLFEIATCKTTRVSDGRSNDPNVAFSRDGKYLLILSQRNFAMSNDPTLNQLNTGSTMVPYLIPLSASTANPLTPKDASDTEEKPPADKPGEGLPVVKVDLEGLFARRVELPVSGSYGQIGMTGGRVLLAGEGQITFFDVAGKKGGAVTPGGGFVISKDGTKLLIPSSRPRVIDTNGTDVPATQGVVGFGGLRLRIEPEKEWSQILDDAWRLLRDYFYVANMHGVDWPSIRTKYRAVLPAVRSRGELDELIRWMQAELGSSHQYLSPGDVGDLKVRSTSASLGIDVTLDASGYYKIARIIRGDGFRASERSPLADPSLKVTEGMFLIEVAGVPAKSGNDIYQGLEGRAGQLVTIKVNDQPSATGARTVVVKAGGDENRMRYLDWVERNRQYVEKASGGRIGYLHMAAMGDGDMADFIKQYFPQRDKEALVIDTRFNNGGYTQEFMNRILNASLGAFFNQRDSRLSWTRQGDAYDGPMACVMNEFNISCGEEFPFRFRELKIGPLIGRRTMGGEVGSSPGWPLVDGGVISVSNYGMYTPEQGWVIEGAGVSPDIDVPSDPNAFLLGRDPQLDKAVEWLTAEVKRRPKRVIDPPKDRVRVGGGG